MKTLAFAVLCTFGVGLSTYAFVGQSWADQDAGIGPTIPELPDRSNESDGTAASGAGAPDKGSGSAPGAAGKVSPEDPAGLLTQIFAAAASGRWGVVVVLVLLLIGAALRVGAKRVKRLAFLTRRWPMWGLNASLAFLTVLGGGMLAAGFNVQLLNVAIMTALSVAGGLELFRDSTGGSAPSAETIVAAMNASPEMRMKVVRLMTAAAREDVKTLASLPQIP